VWEDKESKAKEIPQAVSSIFEGTAESSGDTIEGGDSYTSPSVVSSISPRSSNSGKLSTSKPLRRWTNRTFSARVKRP